jgi:tRNA wybutosine-synthesizing protein 2
VLDLYGGIGYFTLPALIHGEANHVYACEWNPEAAKALRYNLSDNSVAERATVMEGDCRVQARKHMLVNMFDRVSLGLLPSSEGGWWTAVQALRRSTGGWLHIHGNVPVKEVREWTVWFCRRLHAMVGELNPPPADLWAVLCTHVERVKSFAPTVNHYVADVFLGNPTCLVNRGELQPGSVGIVSATGHLELVDLELPLQAPSCALSKDGVLNQGWMIEESTGMHLDEKA